MGGDKASVVFFLPREAEIGVRTDLNVKYVVYLF